MEKDTLEGKNEGTENGGPTGAEKSSLGGVLAQLEAFLDEYMVKKAPFAIPKGGKEFIVSFSPYLIIIFALFFLPVIFAALGLSAALAPFAMMGGYGYGWGLHTMIALLVSIIVFVMEVMAVPGLFKRTKGAWKLLFYASVVSLIGNILSINGLVGGIIGAIIGWYILFQVKDMYKN